MFQQRREFCRQDAEWDASITIGNSVCLSGKVLDWSVNGVFFKPEMSIDSDEFVVGDEILEQLDGFEDGVLAIMGSRGEAVVHMHVRLRWVGESRHHGCRGMGLQNTSVAVAFAQRKAA